MCLCYPSWRCALLKRASTHTQMHRSGRARLLNPRTINNLFGSYHKMICECLSYTLCSQCFNVVDVLCERVWQQIWRRKIVGSDITLDCWFTYTHNILVLRLSEIHKNMKRTLYGLINWNLKENDVEIIVCSTLWVRKKTTKCLHSSIITCSYCNILKVQNYLVENYWIPAIVEQFWLPVSFRNIPHKRTPTWWPNSYAPSTEKDACMDHTITGRRSSTRTTAPSGAPERRCYSHTILHT